MLGVLFLELNGMRFTADEALAAEAVFNLAAGEMSEETYATVLRRNSG